MIDDMINVWFRFRHTAGTSHEVSATLTVAYAILKLAAAIEKRNTP